MWPIKLSHVPGALPTLVQVRPGYTSLSGPSPVAENSTRLRGEGGQLANKTLASLDWQGTESCHTTGTSRRVREQVAQMPASVMVGHMGTTTLKSSGDRYSSEYVCLPTTIKIILSCTTASPRSLLST